LKTTRVILTFLVLGVSPDLRSQGVGQLHDYVVPGHGKLRLRVPDGWSDTSKALEQPASVLLRFRPVAGNAFYVQVTAVWLDPSKLAKMTPESLKASVGQSTAEPLRQAVEKAVTIQELRGKQTLGYYYSLTDRAPPPGEYRYITQGELRVGELLTTFTILHQDAMLPDKKLALAMFTDAIYSP
jgi:hypothetical protein